MNLVTLPANAPRSFYRGSHAIEHFRGEKSGESDLFYPEDWIASTTPQFGRSPLGLSCLPDGRYLLDAIRSDPVAWLGPDHVDRFGADPRLLVKLLDAGERLPVHVHPNGRFATDHLASPFGKTEAWLILEAPEDAAVHLGFARDVGADELAEWRADGNAEDLLRATNRIPVSAGDSVLVPADGSLGLPWDVALQCVDRSLIDAPRLAELRTHRGTSAFPKEADRFFRADLVVPEPSVVLAPAYSVLIVIAGHGEALCDVGTTRLMRGQTVLVPYAAGPVTLRGEDLVVIQARPPVS